MVTPGPAPGLWNIRLLTKKAFDPQVLYPTNSRGEVCGQGAHEGKPYMMMFDITRCLLRINIGLFWSRLCCHPHGCSYHNPWIQIHQPFSCHTTPVIIACTQHVVFVILTRYSQSLNSDASASLLPSKAVQPHPSVLRSALTWHGSGRRERWLWELNIRQKRLDRKGEHSVHHDALNDVHRLWKPHNNLPDWRTGAVLPADGRRWILNWFIKWKDILMRTIVIIMAKESFTLIFWM